MLLCQARFPLPSLAAVSRGIFVGAEQRADLDSTQLTLRLTKLIRAAGASHMDDSFPDDDGQDDYYR